jgi:DNA helicase-2/ATP-dependent DNA helicase PcrA
LEADVATPLEKALDRLDAEQRAVAAWLPAYGNLRVEAEAGSGKTSTFVALLARLFAEGCINPQRAIVTTFANKAAKVFIQRLGMLIPPAFIPDRIGTFHALALRRMRKPARFSPPPHRWQMAQCLDADGRTRNGEVPTNHILWRCATEFGKMPGTGTPSLRCASTAEEVQQYARFADLCRARMVSSGEEYSDVMEGLGVKIKPPQDFDDAWTLVREAKTALRAWDFTDALETYEKQLRQDPMFDSAELIAVDEAQDNTTLMMSIVERLSKNNAYRFGATAEDEGRIVLIGNGSQAIHAWMGAAPEIFAEADKRFKAKTLFLRNNYRSVAEVVALGNAITEGKAWKLGPSAVSARGPSKGDSPVIRAHYAPKGSEEPIADTVAGEIAYAIRVKGARPDEFAILTRTNAALTQYQAALAEADIPHILIGTESLFSQREIETFIAWCMMAETGAFGALEGVLRHPNRFLGKSFIDEVRTTMQSSGATLIPAIEAVGDARGGASQRNAYKLAHDIRELRKLNWDAVPDAVLAMLVPASDKQTKIKAGDSPDEDKPGLFKAACNVFKRFPSAGDACDFVDRCAAMVTSDRDDTVNAPQGRVTLSTAHRSKGREWDHVFVDCSAGSFPSSKSTSRELEDERRLFYVAVTRAANHLGLIVADQPCEFALRYAGAKLFTDVGWIKSVPAGGKHGK